MKTIPYTKKIPLTPFVKLFNLIIQEKLFKKDNASTLPLFAYAFFIVNIELAFN